MEVTAIKTFLNSRTKQLQHAGSTFEAEEGYANDLKRAGIVAPAGATTSATATGAVQQPQKTAAMSAAPQVGGPRSLQSDDPGQAGAARVTTTPKPAAKR